MDRFITSCIGVLQLPFNVTIGTFRTHIKRTSLITNEQKAKVLSRIREIESFVISPSDGATIGAICDLVTAESKELAKSSDSLRPILRTALVINFRESAMESRCKRFGEMFPKISTLLALKQVMDKTKPVEFCKTYLNINATTDQNPKYQLLKALTEGFLEYQKEQRQPSEIGAIRHWSKNVQLDDLKNDFIGKRHGVGPAVVGNIRLCLGERVVKEDRHVIGVVKKCLQIGISPGEYDNLARSLDMEPRYFDCICFKYGQARNISA